MKSIPILLRKIGNGLAFGGRFPLAQSLLRRAFRHAKGTYTVDDFDGDLHIDLRLSEHMQRRIFWMGYYNKNIVALLNHILQSGMTVIDVGANIGEITLVCAKRVGQTGKVIAFEPIDHIADELQKNIERNHLRHVSVVRTGLSDTASSQLPIYASCGRESARDENHGLASLYGNYTRNRPLQFIDITTLDSHLAQHPTDRVDLIKVDIEGAELPFLRGAEHTLRTHRPRLIIEVQDETASAAGYSASDVLDYLSGFGYRFHRIGRSGKLIPLTASTLSKYQDVLCTPT